MKNLEINAKLQIAKPRNEVFDAIIDPEKMSNYFISPGADKMEEGKSVIWGFPEFPDMKIDVKILKLKIPELIIFEWEGSKDRDLEVKIELEERPNNQTLVKLTEGKMEPNEEGITWLGRNTEGWANFLACMKAYLEFGINLREGGFDFMKKPE
ncbi:SRPBCC domain-containing protein [Christiangramia echinicola]|uniref:Uncharacterized conserved protein YndB, AHSA1/START domain n=1 Tax=Christiangramia echinicola TaxID=279359 RepID=A0A1H1M8X8_9FLAO|nr:SRPBCC domain-containing protein [Christiangramia echinicola]SDR83012.1 Uncharacterized conserved protein YndB, AHSA1/START domain [Christiangramia echinicola]